MLSPVEIKYFLEISKHKNISKATQKLGLTQPALTTAIKKIEGYLGCPVFYRLKYGIELTEAGQILLEESQIMTDQWNMLRSKISHTQKNLVGNVSIGCHPTVGL